MKRSTPIFRRYWGRALQATSWQSAKELIIMWFFLKNVFYKPNAITVIILAVCWRSSTPTIRFKAKIKLWQRFRSREWIFFPYYLSLKIIEIYEEKNNVTSYIVWWKYVCAFEDSSVISIFTVNFFNFHDERVHHLRVLIQQSLTNFTGLKF